MAFTFKPLWKKLIDLEMTREDFRKQIGISSSTLARMRKDEYIAMKIVSDICGTFGLTLGEIMEYVPDEKQEKK